MHVWFGNDCVLLERTCVVRLAPEAFQWLQARVRVKRKFFVTGEAKLKPWNFWNMLDVYLLRQSLSSASTPEMGLFFGAFEFYSQR